MSLTLVRLTKLLSDLLHFDKWWTASDCRARYAARGVLDRQAKLGSELGEMQRSKLRAVMPVSASNRTNILRRWRAATRTGRLSANATLNWAA